MVGTASLLLLSAVTGSVCVISGQPRVSVEKEAALKADLAGQIGCFEQAIAKEPRYARAHPAFRTVMSCCRS